MQLRRLMGVRLPPAAHFEPGKNVASPPIGSVPSWVGWCRNQLVRFVLTLFLSFWE